MAAVICLALVGLSFLLVPMFASADTRDASLVDAPAGITIDVGTCSSTLACAGEESFSSDLTALADWQSLINTDNRKFIPTGANVPLMVIRNDTDAVFGPADFTATLDRSGATPRQFQGCTAQPGEYCVVPVGDALSDTDIFPYGDAAVPTKWNVSMTSPIGDAQLSLTGTPVGGWDSVVDGVTYDGFDPYACPAPGDPVVERSGNMSFNLRFKVSDEALAWTRTVLANGGSVADVTSIIQPPISWYFDSPDLRHTYAETDWKDLVLTGM